MPGLAGVQRPGMNRPCGGTLERHNSLDHLAFEAESALMLGLKKSLSSYRNALFDQKALRNPTVSDKDIKTKNIFEWL